MFLAKPSHYSFLPFAILLMGLAPTQAFAEPRYAGSTVRVLLVFDKNAEKVGPAIEKGSEAFIASLKSVRSRLGSDGKMTIDLLGMSDTPVTPQSVLSYYRNLRINPNDALFFYYNGHGATDPNRGHFLAMSGGDLLRADVLKAMQALSPRLTVVASDACSSLSRYENGQQDYTVMVPFYEQRTNRQPPRNVFRDLFFAESGVVDFTAAQAPQYAWAPSDGGLFTQSLAKLFDGYTSDVDVDGDGAIVWNEFLRNVRWDVRERFNHLKKAGFRLSAFGEVEASTQQTPELFKFPSYRSNTTVQLVNMKAVVDDVKIGDGANEGQNGFYFLTINATVWNAKDRQIRFEAHFRNKDGNPIPATDNSFRNSEGFLASGQTYTSKYQTSTFGAVKFYFPKAGINQNNGPLGVYINIRDTETDALLGGSPFLLLKH
jgi:hypothetical protein